MLGIFAITKEKETAHQGPGQRLPPARRAQVTREPGSRADLSGKVALSALTMLLAQGRMQSL